MKYLTRPFHTLRNLCLGLALALQCALSYSAEYQWSVEVPSVISGETKAPPRAFLWIPPNCERVRAVVLGQHNMLEEPILEHPAFRSTLADLGFAEVWVTPAIGGAEKIGAEEGAHFEKMLSDLATLSGYSEIAQAPVVAIGHSALAEFPYLFAAWKPSRVLASISIKGSWPDAKKNPPTSWSGRDVRGVPLLFVSGEYEWAEERAGKALPFRREFPEVPFSMIADAGAGHFDSHDALVRFLSVYLRSAANARLSKDNGALVPIDASKQGWLVDRWRMNQPPRAPAAPVDQYTGDKQQTYWCFDQDHARATEALQMAYSKREPQLVSYEQAGSVVGQDPKTHQQVTLKFLPDSSGDGSTFKLKGTFLDQVPAGRPERWAARPAGSAISHATGGGPVTIRRICGPVQQLAPDTFSISFDRVGTDNPRRSSEIWLLAEHPGDERFKRAVQQAVLYFPLRNSDGADQKITFEPIPNQPAGVKSISLKAVSNAEAKVHFYVREGPAEVDGDTLRFTAIPPRATFPLKVTVVAWQWGRSMEPKRKTAKPVEQTFLVTKTDASK